jgi:hypothetical protein
MAMILFAVRTVWVAILFVIIGISLIWVAFRVMIDFGKWFKEEIIDDFRDHRRKVRQKREVKLQVDEDL